MRRRTNNPWVDGNPADPFLALLIGLAIATVVAAVIMVLG